MSSQSWLRVISVLVGLAHCVTASAQVTQRFQFELSERDAATILSIPQEELNQLREGKERLSNEGLDGFRNQFGLLPNGMPTFQVGPGEFFVLIPLGDLNRQGEFDAEANQQKVQKLPPAAPPRGARKKAASAGSMRIDHRPQQTAIRNQGERGTCVAFASCAELEAIENVAGNVVDLSENLAYLRYMQREMSTPCQDPGLATYRAAEYLKLDLVCEETHWPYVSTDPQLLMNTQACSTIDAAPNLTGKPGWGVADYLHLPKGTETNANGSIDIRDTQTLESLLQRGHNIVFGSVVAWRTQQTNAIIDVTLGPAGQPIFGSGGHAMLIVGYDRSGPKPYVIVKNSWGASYGHSGYLYFTYDYIRTYAKYGYVTTSLRRGNL